MKKVLKYFVVASLALGAVSCEDYLEIPSETKLDSGSIFETPGRAEMTVLAAYEAGYNREMWYQLGAGAEDVLSTEGDTNSKNQIGNYVLSGSVTGTALYTASYTAIEYANVCIKGLAGKEGAEYQKLLGEVYAIRAAAYLNLIRFWGDVPYPTVPVADQPSFSSSRVSRDEIYDGCIADLQKAVELVPWKSEINGWTPERYCKESVYGLLARMSLYAAGFSLRWDLETYDKSTLKLAQRDDAARVKELYQIAADACQAVISRQSFKLSSSFEAVWRDLLEKVKFNEESMLEQGQYGTNVNKETGYTNGMFCHQSSMFGKAAPAQRINPTLYFHYGEGDTRRDVSICTYAVDNNSMLHLLPYSCYRIGKYRATWKSEIGTAVNKRDMNWSWMRYSHILLMYAEALNEVNNGPTQAAKDALKEVRMRAYAGDESKIGTIPSDYQGFRDAIIEENLLEFAAEAWRRTDLVRWGIHYEKLMANKAELLDLAACRQGTRYENIDRYRVYTPKAGEFKDVTVLPYESITKKKLTDAEINALQVDGKKVVDMHRDSKVSNTGNYCDAATFDADGSIFGEYKGADDFEKNNKGYSDIYRGLTKNQTELCPLGQTQVIDVNPGLQGQQHPAY